MTFQDFAACIPEGFKAMVSPMLILTLAWTLSGMTGLLGAKYYVASLLSGSAAALQHLLPIIIFVVAVFLAFATGTSWGTSILVPIVCHAFPEGEMLVVSIAACLSGAVCGDHCSPISDTTIMASAGAHCVHVNHVSTQLPYAMTAAAISAGLPSALRCKTGCPRRCRQHPDLLRAAGPAIVIELVVLSLVRARMGHTGRKKSQNLNGIVDFCLPLRRKSWYTYQKSKFFELFAHWRKTPCWKKSFRTSIQNSSCIFIRMYFSALPPAKPR